MAEALDPLTGHVLRTEDCGSSQTHLLLTEPILLPAAEELPAPAMNGRAVRGPEIKGRLHQRLGRKTS